MPRFFVPTAQFCDLQQGHPRTLTVLGEDAHHISRSLRMAVGEHIVVCPADGACRGQVEYACRLTAFDGTSVEAEVEQVLPCRAEPPYALRLYVALSKADKLETVIQKAVECGACAIVPFVSSRCIAKPGDGEEKKLLRRQRIVLEAAKQCGRGLVPEITQPISYAAMLREAAAADLPLFCYEGEQTLTLPDAIARADAPVRTVSVVVGAEGGFSPDEAAAAQMAGLWPVGLGARILRCETAPVFALACISYALELGSAQE
ncbi:MAG: 16S rRNA (uracil(1498)-N(3))-methyltransferase [Clostridia bacterium]|nr:16S rRNA (uracil(1498)-N(3))-methyltransferase [Clostridia bacterium]